MEWLSSAFFLCQAFVVHGPTSCRACSRCSGNRASRGNVRTGSQQVYAGSLWIPWFESIDCRAASIVCGKAGALLLLLLFPLFVAAAAAAADDLAGRAGAASGQSDAT